MSDKLRTDALNYHQFPKPGKLEITPTKPLASQIDLSLAYSPGVAFPCEEIAANPELASKYTSRSNLVGVISNGSAVLGLGNIGALASKPVMEGKACLFKAFSGIDVFDIELDESDPDKLVEAIAMLEPTLGGINLEDIKAPECFYIEEKLRERMNIPVFHDDQHGTAIISCAAIINALDLVGKQIEKVKLVCSGAGAAAIACLNLLVKLGLQKENIKLVDSKGVVTTERTGLDKTKQAFAVETSDRTLADAVKDADVFLGCSAAGLLKPEMLMTMAEKPVILALANPEPEIRPEVAKSVRPDCIIATGRSDYPNQVNNVLCFPFIFRGALDVGASAITEEMKVATVKAISKLTKMSASTDKISQAYSGQTFSFGPDYIIPKPFDPRLISAIAPAVAECALKAGIAKNTDFDIAKYRKFLEASIYHTGLIMKPVFERAMLHCPKIVFTEGEDKRILQAAQVLVDEGIAQPVLLGDRHTIESHLTELNSTVMVGKDIEVVGVDHSLTSRTLQGRLLVDSGDAQGMICGLEDSFLNHLEHVATPEMKGSTLAAMNLLLLKDRNLFICDTYVNETPSEQQLADIAVLAAKEAEKMGIQPSIAFLTNAHDTNSESYRRMSAAKERLEHTYPHLNVAGVMQADSALSLDIRSKAMPGAIREKEANVLVMPNVDSANITYNLLKVISGQGVTVGPFLLGCDNNIHILTPAASVRRVVNMSAVIAANQ